MVSSPEISAGTCGRFITYSLSLLAYCSNEWLRVYVAIRHSCCLSFQEMVQVDARAGAPLRRPLRIPPGHVPGCRRWYAGTRLAIHWPAFLVLSGERVRRIPSWSLSFIMYWIFKYVGCVYWQPVCTSNVVPAIRSSSANHKALKYKKNYYGVSLPRHLTERWKLKKRDS